MENLTRDEKITLKIILMERIETLEHEKQSTLENLREANASQFEAYCNCCELRMAILDKQLKETKNLLDKLVY